MKYVFNIVDYSTIKVHHSSLLYRPSETVQEFVNRTTPETEYTSIIDIKNGNLNILTNAIESTDYATSYNVKISDVEEVLFKRVYNGKTVLLFLLTLLILLVPIILFIISNNYRVLLMLFFLGGILILALGDTIELMGFKTNNKSIFIPIREYMGIDDCNIELKKMCEELHSYNPDIIWRENQHKHNIKTMHMCKKFLIILICAFIVTLGIMMFL